jgi:jumonji domain-containing protein 7
MPFGPCPFQHQNSSLTVEYPALVEDIQPGLPWAEDVFGGPPEATNLWIGDERSVTSFHKDHYENLYGKDVSLLNMTFPLD